MIGQQIENCAAIGKKNENCVVIGQKMEICVMIGQQLLKYLLFILSGTAGSARLSPDQLNI